MMVEAVFLASMKGARTGVAGEEVAASWRIFALLESC
jgi:hypothetical protein